MRVWHPDDREIRYPQVRVQPQTMSHTHYNCQCDDPRYQRPTHGRHCDCTPCKAQDWSDPTLAPCGMHGTDCEVSELDHGDESWHAPQSGPRPKEIGKDTDTTPDTMREEGWKEGWITAI